MKHKYTIKNNVLAFYKGIFSQWFGGFNGQKSSFKIDLSEWQKFCRTYTEYEAVLNYYEPYDCDPLYSGHYTDHQFNCCEQAMMFGKALVFQDFETADEILKENNPKNQKALGRKIKNFDQQYWEKVRLPLVTMINLHKFKQNPELAEELISTGQLILVEASPIDFVWGCGTDDRNDNTYDVRKWQGLNLLGRALMRVREQLQDI
jgi:ribA/ribD-fused uncharacterized protein